VNIASTAPPPFCTGFSDFVTNVHVPYWFDRVSKPSHETDLQGEAPLVAGAKQGESTADNCPACGNLLNSYSVFSIDFEGCPNCKGIWLFADELRKLKNKVGGASLRWLNDEIENLAKTSVTSGKRFCVKCKTTRMVSVIFGKSSIVIDWCPRCHGVWLDRGEFDAIIQYLKSELSQMHPAEIERQATADLGRIWSGGPESRFEEFLDAKAAVSALISATIFEHPTLFKLLMSIPRF
jgi:Zn-finger nucleic acid-binding protein